MKDTVENFIVPWVRTTEPYSDAHMDFAWENPQIVRMMSNENLLEPSQKVLDAIMAAARQGNLYPGSGEKLRKMLGERAGLTEKNVVLGCGSTDVINFVVQTFVAPGEEVVISVPTFPMYEARVKTHGGVVVSVPMTKDFYWDVDAIIKAVTPQTKLLFLCSPNNPTGNQIDDKDLRRILDLGVPTFFDEAYFELEDTPKTRAGMIKDYPNMFVNRTFSKAYGLAGFRLGYILCHESLFTFFNRVRIPWNASLVVIAAAIAQLEDVEDIQRKRKNTIDGRNYLIAELKKIPGLIVYPSQGNFVLVDAGVLGKTSNEIKEGMLQRGIFIRQMSGHNMTSGFFRITVGTPAQNRNFIEKFNDYILSLDR
ncbi:MAG TPA: histidinol-phosphate transaminase [Longilinea sp.]|nr:histidinol-phosphate transaminase [Longilinea sp.]